VPKENKAVVRRFLENVAAGRDVSVADDVLAPSYVNLAFEGVDIAGVKAMTSALYAVVGEARTGSLALVAEGDAVFARFDYSITLADGTERTARWPRLLPPDRRADRRERRHDGAGPTRSPRAAHESGVTGFRVFLGWDRRDARCEVRG
jgi:hypothetical protein